MVDDLTAVGGEAGVARILRRFVDRVFADLIIGYLFDGKDRERIWRFEVQHAMRQLGAEIPYQGRPLVAVHRPLRIHAGHFRRRLAILRTVLAEEGVPEDVASRWVAADAKFERAFTEPGDCGPPEGTA